MISLRISKVLILIFFSIAIISTIFVFILLVSSSKTSSIIVPALASSSISILERPILPILVILSSFVVLIVSTISIWGKFVLISFFAPKRVRRYYLAFLPWFILVIGSGSWMRARILYSFFPFRGIWARVWRRSRPLPRLLFLIRMHIILPFGWYWVRRRS